jgi:hypothetical protein
VIRKRQFTLRTLLIALTGCCVLFAFLARIKVMGFPVLVFISGYTVVLIGGDRDRRLIWLGLGLIALSALHWYIIISTR